MYSPVNAWPVRSLTPVATIGCGSLESPWMKGGGWPSGGFMRARYAGCRRGASIQLFCHSVKASSCAVRQIWASVGGGCYDLFSFFLSLQTDTNIWHLVGLACTTCTGVSSGTGLL